MMIKSRLCLGLIVGAVALGLAACLPAAPSPSQPLPGRTPLASTTAMPRDQVTTLPTPQAPVERVRVSPWVTVELMLTPETASPATSPQAPGLVSQFFLGVPAGDSYLPTDVALDLPRHLAYVYYARGAQGDPGIAVVDLATGQVTRQLPLVGFTANGSGGRLWLARDGEHAFVTEQETATLTLLDLAAGTTLARLSAVRDAGLSPDGLTLYVIAEGTVRAFDTGALLETDRPAPRWRVALSGANRLVANSQNVLIARAGSESELVLLDGASGDTRATHPLPDDSPVLALGPDGGWAVRTGGIRPQVQRFDANLQLQASATVADGGAFHFDEPRQRYILTGYRSSQADLSSNPVIVTLAANDLVTQTETLWQGTMAPDVFVPYDEDQLLGLTRFTGAQLLTLDPASFMPTARTVLGVELTGAALDLTTATLFVADNQERIHVLDWPSGHVRTVWPGGAPLALDTTDRRLYVNRAGHVVALDSQRGDVLAEFDRAGFPAPDGPRDRVYIANAGITIYDRSGRTVDQLDKTFPTPQGFSPNPRAIAVHVNPANGSLWVVMNNGVPGSNNSDSVQVFMPGSDTPAVVASLYNFVHDIIFDPADGTAYISYAGKGNDAIQRLRATGQETGRLTGRTGLLVLDDASRSLRVQRDGVLARVDAAALELRGVDDIGAPADQLLLDPARRWLVVRDENSATLRVAALDRLAPLAMRPQPGPIPPDRPTSDLQATADDRGTVLYSRIDNQLFRSRDGQHWEQLLVGSWESYGHLTLAEPGLLFYTNLVEGGSDGVLRSRDGGDTWEYLNAGLSDLRLAQPVVARGIDVAYASDRSGRLLAWRSPTQRWEVILEPANAYTPPGTLSLAPDGTLLLLSYDRYRRSTDGGLAWVDVPVPGPGGQIVGFATDYAASPTVYAFFGSDAPYLARSRDGGLTWDRLTAQPAIQPYAPNFEFAVTGQTLYLYTSDYTGRARLLRSLDEGATWQEADGALLQGSHQLALAPDGRLWLGFPGKTRAHYPADLRWTTGD